MARISRIIVPGFPNHVTQQGNYRQVVFEESQDYLRYLELIKEYSQKYGLKIWAYCLMSNHFHFIVVPSCSDALAGTFKNTHMMYSRYFNQKKKQSRHLWQGRFFSCCLDESHLFASVRYVENNSVRAGLVKRAKNYRWSSAPSHVNGENNPNLSNDLPLLQQVQDWREFLRESDEERLLNKLRRCTQSGHPAGADGFTEKLEVISGRKIKAEPIGRPKKKENK